MSRIKQGSAGLLPGKIFTVSSDWALITRVADQVREVARRYRRDRFFVLDKIVRKKLADPATCEREVWSLVGDTDLYETGAFQVLLKKSLNGIEAGRFPSKLAALLKDQIKHRAIGSQDLVHERAPTLSYTLRVRWNPTAQRSKNTRSWLLIDFRHYAPVAEQDLQREMYLPAFEDHEDPLEAKEAYAQWEATYGQEAREAQERRHRLWKPLKKITIAVWLDHVHIPGLRLWKASKSKQLDARRKRFLDACRTVRQQRLVAGDDSHHWKWLCVGPESLPEDIILLLVLYLAQERMVELTPESSQFLQGYFRRFKWASQLGDAELLDKDRQRYVLAGGGVPFEHMLRLFCLPQDWRTLRKYIGETLPKLWMNEHRAKRATMDIDGNTSRFPAQDTEDSTDDRITIAPRGDWSPVAGEDVRLYSIAEGLCFLEERGVRVPKSTLYEWIEVGKVPYVMDGEQKKLTVEGLRQVAACARPRDQRKAIREYLVATRGIQPASAKTHIWRHARRGETLEDIAGTLIHHAGESGR